MWQVQLNIQMQRWSCATHVKRYILYQPSDVLVDTLLTIARGLHSTEPLWALAYWDSPEKNGRRHIYFLEKKERKSTLGHLIKRLSNVSFEVEILANPKTTEREKEREREKRFLYNFLAAVVSH